MKCLAKSISLSINGGKIVFFLGKAIVLRCYDNASLRIYQIFGAASSLHFQTKCGRSKKVVQDEREFYVGLSRSSDPKMLNSF